MTDQDNQIKTKAYAAMKCGELLEFHQITRRSVQDHDIHIEIQYSGICHTDIHQARGDWGTEGSIFPMVN